MEDRISMHKRFSRREKLAHWKRSEKEQNGFLKILRNFPQKISRKLHREDLFAGFQFKWLNLIWDISGTSPKGVTVDSRYSSPFGDVFGQKWPAIGNLRKAARLSRRDPDYFAT